MAHPSHYELLLSGKDHWNSWRKANPEIVPDLIKANLSRASLAEIDLHGANLTDADLYEADLSQADLRKAILHGANLTDAKLSGANLEMAELWGACLQKADLAGVNLTGANLSRVNLTGANLSGAILIEANLNRADLLEANFTATNLTGANLSGADLTGADFSRAKLTLTSFSRGTQCLATNFTKADLRGVDLSLVNLDKALLTDAVLLAVSVYITTINQHQIDQLTNQVKRLMGKYDLEIAKDPPAKIGSWFKEWHLKVRGFLGGKEIQDRLSGIDRDLQDEFGSMAALLKTLPNDADAVILIKSLIIISIRNTESNVNPKIFVRTLTRKELLFLERNQHLLQNPCKLLKALSDLYTSC